MENEPIQGLRIADDTVTAVHVQEYKPAAAIAGVPGQSGDGATSGWTIENKLTLADIIFKALAALAVIVGGFLGVAKYFDDQKLHREAQQQQSEAREKEEFAKLEQRKIELKQLEAKQTAEHEQRRKEFQLKFFDQRVLAYIEICDAAARIASATRLNTPEAAAARVAFDRLYWGKVCIFESEEVAQKQIEFYNAIKQVASADRPPPALLNDLSYKLAHACRDHLGSTFALELGALTKGCCGRVP